MKFTRKKEGDEAALKILHEFREDCLRILGKQEQAVHDCETIEPKDRQRGEREKEGESKKGNTYSVKNCHQMPYPITGHAFFEVYLIKLL